MYTRIHELMSWVLYWLLCLGAGVVIASAQWTAPDAHQLLLLVDRPTALGSGTAENEMSISSHLSEEQLWKVLVGNLAQLVVHTQICMQQQDVCMAL